MEVFRFVCQTEKKVESRRSIHMNVNGNEVVALEEERNRREVDYAPDSILNFSFSLSDVYLFDAESGRNILYGVDNE